MLYLLKQCEDISWSCDPDEDPWGPGWNCAWGFVVRAQSVEQARALAALKCGDEGETVWLDEKYTTCELLHPEGTAVVILQNYKDG